MQEGRELRRGPVEVTKGFFEKRGQSRGGRGMKGN